MSDVSTTGIAVRVDAHHHLWRYTAHEYDWLQGELAPLRRDFSRDDLRLALRTADVKGAVSVQARQTIAETDWLLHTAAETSEIAGVVGWLPLADAEIPRLLARYSKAGKLCGLRHVVQAESAGFLDADAFNFGVRAMRNTRLVYDLLIHQAQLTEAIRFVDRHPEQVFVLDHIAKPLIRSAELQPWATSLRQLAQRDNVVCKLSGMVTEAGAGWTPERLRPYFEVVLDAFTPERLMVGSDWPVLLAHCEYAEWWALVEHWTEPLSNVERAAVLGGTAVRTYGLQIPGTTKLS